MYKLDRSGSKHAVYYNKHAGCKPFEFYLHLEQSKPLIAGGRNHWSHELKLCIIVTSFWKSKFNNVV